jgi:hypothetical protein
LSFFLSFYLVTLPPRAISADNTEHTYFFFFSRSCSWTRTTTTTASWTGREEEREKTAIYSAPRSLILPASVPLASATVPNSARDKADTVPVIPVNRSPSPAFVASGGIGVFSFLSKCNFSCVARDQLHQVAAAEKAKKKKEEKKEEGRIGILFFSFVE